jgi:hypothetical protein
MLFHLGYVSTERQPMTADDCLLLLRAARERNARLGLTGLLLHREGSFFQVLEGEAENVHTVFESIRRDARHERIEVLFEGPIERREFADWRMGFVELEGVEIEKLPGFSDFLVGKTDARGVFAELSQAKRLMLLFRTMQ